MSRRGDRDADFLSLVRDIGELHQLVVLERDVAWVLILQQDLGSNHHARVSRIVHQQEGVATGGL